MRRLTVLGLAFLGSLAALPARPAEGRIPIPFTSPVVTPVTITSPGKYVLTGPLAATGAGPLVVVALPAAPETAVEIDLNGFVLDNAANPGDPVVSVSGAPPGPVTIRNGSLAGGSEGVFVATAGAHVVVEDVKIGATTSFGIHLVDVERFAIRRCVIGPTGENAILLEGAGLLKAGTIEGNVIRDCAGGIAVLGPPPPVFDPDLVVSSVAILNNRIEHVVAGPFPGGIHLRSTDGCLVSNNTIENVMGEGIRVHNTHGCKFYNNVLMKLSEHGMHFLANSFDNLVLDNVVVHAGWDGLFPPELPFDGILIEAGASLAPGALGGMHVERNVLNRNGRYGLHFTGSGNHFGRNTARGNNWVGAPACSTTPPGSFCPPWLTIGTTLDFCDETEPAFDNYSFCDNLMGRLEGDPPVPVPGPF